jgi:hypothetical protein
MGMIGEALVSQVNKFAKIASLADYAGNLQNIGVDPNSVKDVKQLIDDGLDPLHAAYVAMQHLVSLFAESVSVLPELKAYCDIAGPAEEEYIPKGPPLSPLTGSYFTCWAFFDLQFGPDKETIGTCLLDVAEYLDYSADMDRVLELMQNSRMGIYEHCGSQRGRIWLQELISQKNYLCHIPAGYSGGKGQRWLVRIFPPINDSFDYSVVFNTPYVLMDQTKDDWIVFVKRTLLGMGEPDNAKAFYTLMKYGLETNYWNEYIFQAFHHNQNNAIFPTGLPDVKGSLPHGDLGKTNPVIPKRRVQNRNLKLKKKRRRK